MGRDGIIYLTLCVVYQGVAIPIFWLDLHKHGISSFKERKKLLTKAMRHFDLSGKTLLADREHIGKEWFNLLVNNHINFVIRAKKKTYKEAINQAQGRSYDQMINLAGDARTKLLMAIMVFAYVISIFEGFKTYSSVPIKHDKDRTSYKAESVFRFGINCIAKFTQSLNKFCSYITQQIQQANKKYRSANILIV